MSQLRQSGKIGRNSSKWETRNNAAVVDFVKMGQFFSLERLRQAIAQFQEVSRHKLVISIGNGFVFYRVPQSTLQRR